MFDGVKRIGHRAIEAEFEMMVSDHGKAVFPRKVKDNIELLLAVHGDGLVLFTKNCPIIQRQFDE